ncbi:MAG: GSCFA domain-containing protein [Fibrobacter sp.]|uniref:GSCFA domain-containing protein n=1 Tax=Fibrobacter sp. TaxID=35828 RepID=UPI002A91B35D|nr:GSCFA domain-containing protein [Fibrobacter sp.]MDY6265341.1 GSCFA domain-containing protein [Fibrobacter sp.]
MNLYTKVDIPATNFKIDYSSRLAFFGSCFADNISAQFAERKFKVMANPFGTVYNPISLASQLKAIAEGKVFKDKDVFKDERCDGLWHCWSAHSSLSAHTREECIAKLNAATTQARDFLQKADIVFVTLGTSFVYFLKGNGEPVSNCHRQDPNLFTRRMISVEEATDSIRETVTSIRQLNPNTSIVFTVSPLRHMSDGAHNNTLSKATLQLAINNVLLEIATVATLPRNDNVSRVSAGDFIEHFPSYEIVMDELRDYRFYESDMVHLSRTAEEYIFERMADTYCSEITCGHIAKVEKFLKGARHRIQDESSPATQDFLKKINAQAAQLEAEIPGLNLSDEKRPVK